jgi:hypothetical protein
MRSLRLLLLALFVLAGLALMASCHHADLHTALRTQFSAPQSGPVLLAAYQPWFGRPGHINVGYSSQDPNTLVRQINEARDLNISGFVANWYGSRHEFEDRSYYLLQNAAAAENNFKVAILYDEDVDDAGPSTDRVIVDLQYAYDRYIGPHAVPSRSAYLRYDGHPLIFIFPKGGHTDWARVHQVVNSWDDPPLLIYKDPHPNLVNSFDGFYAWVNPGSGGWVRDGSNWGRDYLNNFYLTMSSKYPNKLAVGAAWPGFDDSRASWSRNRHMSGRCGRTFEDSLRLFRRYYNDQHPLPFLMIETWNDYEEGTAIEHGLDRCGGRSQSSSD